MKHLDRLRLRAADGGCLIAVKVAPGASRDRIAGVLGDALKVATSAPPEKGKANRAVAETIAEALDLDKRSVEIVSGATSARKEYEVRGLSPGALRERLAKL